MQKSLLRYAFGAVLSLVTVIVGNARSELKTQDSRTTIKKILEYPIKPEILERVQTSNPSFSDEYMRSLGVELKRYFALRAFLHNEPIPMFSKDVDELWHAFILFTKEYQQFCQETFGSFLHHVPTTKAEKSARTPESTRAAKEKFIADYTACFGQAPDQRLWFGKDSPQSSCGAGCHGDSAVESCEAVCHGGSWD